VTLSAVPPRDFATIPSIPVREPSRAPSDTPPRSIAPAFRLLDDVQVLELPDPEWSIDGILPRRAIVGLYGPPGSYKTTLIAGLHVAVATGQPWLGHRIANRGASIYVGAEDVSGFKIRLAAAKRAARLSLSHTVGVFCFPEAIDLLSDVSVDRFLTFIRESGGAFELVTIDTYSASTPGAAENSSEDTTAAMMHAQQIRDALRATVVLVHHTNASGTRERGHSAMRGSADTMISLTPVDDAVEVECSKQRNGAPFPKLTLKPVPVPEGGCVLRLAADVMAGPELTPTQAAVLSILQETFMADGATKSEWQRACQHIPERSFHRAAKILVERKRANQVGTHFRPAPPGGR